MKKVLFGLAALLLTAMVFTGCSDDVVPYSFTAGNVRSVSGDDILFSKVAFYVTSSVPTGISTSSTKTEVEAAVTTAGGARRTSITNADVDKWLYAAEFDGADKVVKWGTVNMEYKGSIIDLPILRTEGKNIVVWLKTL
jgi:hypothetical protein